MIACLTLKSVFIIKHAMKANFLTFRKIALDFYGLKCKYSVLQVQFQLSEKQKLKHRFTIVLMNVAII